MEHSFSKCPETELDQYIAKKTDNLISIYNHILDQEEKISENVNNEFLEREIHEMELFRINEKKFLERTKNSFFAREAEKDTYNKLLSEAPLNQCFFEALVLDEEKDCLSFKLKNNFSVEFGKKEDLKGGSIGGKKLSMEDEEDKGELKISGYVRNQDDSNGKDFFIF